MAAELPIRLFAQDIIAAVKENNIVVVIGETGSGKTTQISQVNPLMLLTHPRNLRSHAFHSLHAQCHNLVSSAHM